jgi:hypothetical protein
MRRMGREMSTCQMCGGRISRGRRFLVLKPDRDACVAAVGREVDAIIASDQPADASSFESEEVRSRLRWPCRFQYKQDMEAIGREVMASRLPELLAKGLSEAF